MKFQIGDLVIINDRPYGGCFEGDIGYIHHKNKFYVLITLIKHNESHAFRYEDFKPYYEIPNW